MFGDDFVTYTVKSGDTLDKIAKLYGTTYQAIAKTNMLDDPNKIEVGQELMIYPGTVSVAKPVDVAVPTVMASSAKSAASSASTVFGINKWVVYGGLFVLAAGIVMTAKKMKESQAW